MKPLLLSLLFVEMALYASEARTSTDVQGRSIDVLILAVTESAVQVEMLDGREFEIPFERLSGDDQAYLRAWSPPPVKTPDSPIDSVVIIRAGEGSGSGFFAHDGGKTYLYTNQHVIADTRSVKAIDAKGRTIELGALEVSNTQDMARFRVDVEVALKITDEVRPDETLQVLGNGEGAGVITSASAVVRGIGPFEVEVDADFVPGNSGGPVVNAAGEVVGMATYIRAAQQSPSWITQDTRYGKARRFTLRPLRIDDWVKVDVAEYAKQIQQVTSLYNQVIQSYWAYVVLKEGDGRLAQIPPEWDREIVNILKNHNRRQERPYTGGGSFNHYQKLESSRRTNLRALERYLDAKKSDFYRLNNANLTIDYFKDNRYNGSRLIEKQVEQLLQMIQQETEGR